MTQGPKDYTAIYNKTSDFIDDDELVYDEVELDELDIQESADGK